MTHSTRNFARLSARINRVDPLLAYELERNVIALARSSAVNPGVQKLEDHVESMIGTLKSVRQDLKKALDDFETADEFAKFFQEGALDEEFGQLRKLLERASKLPPIPAKSASVAGPTDWFKKLWNGKKDKKHGEVYDHKQRDDDEYGVSPSYRMDDSTMDDFVEGKKDWADPGHYIQEETHQNKEFFDGASDLMKKVQETQKKPERNSVKALFEAVGVLIKKGEGLLKGLYRHLEEPAAKVDLGDESDKNPAPGKKSIFDLEGTVDHYVDMLKGSSGDAKKTLSLLKELFDAVSPALGDDRASLASSRLASVLIRTAHAHPSLRKGLMPLIKKATSSKSPLRTSRRVSA